MLSSRRAQQKGLRDIMTSPSGSGIVLIETDDPTLAIKHVNPWSGMCDSTITPVVNDKKALEILPKQ